MTAVIIQATPNSKLGFKCYGAADEFWRYKGHEVILSGPYETGKTISCLHKLNGLAVRYPDAKCLMVRKTYNSMIASTVVTYEQKVLAYPPGHPQCGVKVFGKNKPEWYDYTNGSRIILGGMDNPDKFLSSEFDFIYVNQAEELRLDDWEKLTGRATGRAGNAPYAQVFGDCNPGAPSHWIKQRPSLKLLNSRHEHNPTLFDPETGEITDQGQRTMAILDELTGVRYKRGRLGIWAGVEGMVYEAWNEDVHLIDADQLPQHPKRVLASVDWGFTNPGVIQVWFLDGDDRLYLAHEVYQTHKAMEWWIEQARALQAQYNIEVFVCDPSEPEHINAFRRVGLNAVNANNEIVPGVQRVQARLKVRDDGKPRLYMSRDALADIDPYLVERRKPTCTAEEMPNYAYPPTRDGKQADEHPVKVDDHGQDATRYMVSYVDDKQPEAVNIKRRRRGESDE